MKTRIMKDERLAGLPHDADGTARPKRLAVCVATCGPVGGLSRLLDGLDAQVLPGGWTVEIRVADNDARTRRTLAPTLAWRRHPIVWIAEPRRGVSHARNAALEAGPADAFAFIDDDEIPVGSWIAALVRRIDDGADAVVGPVRGRPTGDAPEWIVRGGFLDKPGRGDGAEIVWGETRTSSAAIAGHWLNASGSGLRFDPDLARTGGEDVDLFRRISAAGGRIFDEPGALVYEDVPPERCRPVSILRRRQRAGMVYGHLCRRERADGRDRGLARTAGRIAMGGLMVVAGMPGAMVRRPETSFQGLARIAVAIGIRRSTAATPNFAVYGVPRG